MVRGKKLHALIWWVDSAYKDVVSLSVFPKAQRKVNAVANLSWKDFKTGKNTKVEAKILAISDDVEELNSMVVTESGDISPPSNKVVSASVIAEKKKNNQNEKLRNSIKMSHDKQLAEVISSSKPIFPTSTEFRNESDPAHQQWNEQNTQSKVLTPSCHTDKPHTITREMIECQWPEQHMPTNQSIHPVSGYKSQPMATYGPQTGYWTDSQFWKPTHYINVATPERSPARYGNITTPGLFPDYSNMATAGLPAVDTQLQEAPSSLSRSTHEPVSQETVPGRDNAWIPGNLEATVDANSDIEVDVDNDTGNDSNDDDNSSSSSLISKKENSAGAVRAMAATLPGKIRKRDIAFQDLLLEAMKYSYKISNAADYKCTETLKIADHHLRPGSDMEEISPNSGFFMRKEKIAYINLVSKTDDGYNWKIIVREVLLDIYGTTLANHSAVGKRGERPPINTQLFRGLHEWTNRVSGGVARKDFIKHINKCASNKRKYRSHKNNEKVSGKRLKKSSHPNQVTSKPLATKTKVTVTSNVLMDQTYRENIAGNSEVQNRIPTDQSTCGPGAGADANGGRTYTQD